VQGTQNAINEFFAKCALLKRFDWLQDNTILHKNNELIRPLAEQTPKLLRVQYSRCITSSPEYRNESRKSLGVHRMLCTWSSVETGESVLLAVRFSVVGFVVMSPSEHNRVQVAHLGQERIQTDW